jgi:hypothetical protein
MMNLGWCAPPRRVDAQTARQNVHKQHDRIRGLLDRARVVAELALDGHAPSADAVASAIGNIHTTITVHLAFEESVLLPILNDDLPLGPERARRLVEEHAHQRTMLEALHREACAGPLVPTLAAKLAFLTSWLLTDMEEEERTLVTPETVRDDVIIIDQDGG